MEKVGDIYLLTNIERQYLGLIETERHWKLEKITERCWVYYEEDNLRKIIEVIQEGDVYKRQPISGRSGLLNVKTNELIGNLDYYSTMDNYPSTAFIQKKGNPSSINYYDIKKHEYVVYDFELVKSLRNIFLLKSKADNKTCLLYTSRCV